MGLLILAVLLNLLLRHLLNLYKTRSIQIFNLPFLKPLDNPLQRQPVIDPAKNELNLSNNVALNSILDYTSTYLKPFSLNYD